MNTQKSPVQVMFEQMAAQIMAKAQKELQSYSVPSNRVKIINGMNEELQALKKAYEGLLSGPVMDVPFCDAVGLELQ